MCSSVRDGVVCFLLVGCRGVLFLHVRAGWLARPRSPHVTPLVVVQIHLVTGELVCPNCERRYPVTNGIPNMLLRDDEL